MTQAQDEQDIAMRLWRESVPPARSFKVLRQARDESSGGTVILGGPSNYEWIGIDAHSYGCTDSGALAFHVQEFNEKGLQGMGIYGRVVLMLAPGEWIEVQEITKSMQLRAIS